MKEGSMLFLPGAKLSDADRAKMLGYLFIKPLHGRFTSGFGIRRDPFTGGTGYHAGVDIAGEEGTPVCAAKEGTVEYAGWYGGYGRCIILRHQFGYETVYGHLSSINVKPDTYVKVGQFIGRLGNTGRSTGPHLHFEVRKWGRPTNPLRLAGLARNGSWF
jgi:murein DD-endopeptidase MepM/ murein hydrolase activator NlpD